MTEQSLSKDSGTIGSDSCSRSGQTKGLASDPVDGPQPGHVHCRQPPI